MRCWAVLLGSVALALALCIPESRGSRLEEFLKRHSRAETPTAGQVGPPRSTTLPSLKRTELCTRCQFMHLVSNSVKGVFLCYIWSVRELASPIEWLRRIGGDDFEAIERYVHFTRVDVSPSIPYKRHVGGEFIFLCFCHSYFQP